MGHPLEDNHVHASDLKRWRDGPQGLERHQPKTGSLEQVKALSVETVVRWEHGTQEVESASPFRKPNDGRRDRAR